MSKDKRPKGAHADESAVATAGSGSAAPTTASLFGEPSTSASGTGELHQHRRRRFANLTWWQESGLVLVGAVVLAVVLKAFFVQAYYIPSGSMQPTLERDDRIVVQKVSYWFGGSPSRGDVVVFEDPGGWLNSAEAIEEPGGLKGVLARIGLYPTAGHLVKRVIGVPGDTVECCDDQGRIMVNGQPLDEDYLAAPPDDGTEPCNGPETGTCEWTSGRVPDGRLFVLGDNRYHSGDSVAHLCLSTETDCTDDPYVDEGLVEGKVFAVAWPRDHARLLGRPDVFNDVPDPQ